MFLKCLPHSTTRLMSVGAVAETTLLGKVEYLLEIACYLLTLHVERAEPLDAGSIDDVTVLLRSFTPLLPQDRNHLTERSGVHSSLMGIADVSST